jgi:hypothetical protein
MHQTKLSIPPSRILWLLSQISATRYYLMLALTRLVDRARLSMTCQLTKSANLGVQMDGWSSGSRHLAALCIPVPGVQFFANAYEI